ncbi:MAG: hypothetical protein NVS1B14_04790 [Vulcanimicrobiaceae bacterium]
MHRDVAGEQHGLGVGALLEFTVTGRRLGVHAEGIPVVSSPQRGSLTYGQATPAVGVLSATLRVAVDRRSRYWVGLGTTVINQRTPLPSLGQVASSRLAGVRYEVLARLPSAHAHFVEILIGGAPRLRGADHFFYSNGSHVPDKDEIAAEEDFSVAFGVQRLHSEILAGIRSLNFSAAFSRSGMAADRNNGIGVTLEMRRYL